MPDAIRSLRELVSDRTILVEILNGDLARPSVTRIRHSAHASHAGSSLFARECEKMIAKSAETKFVAGVLNG